MTASVHPTAIIDPAAVIGNNVEVDAYAIIGPKVTVGDNCRIGAHCVLTGTLKLGRGNVIGRHCCLGADPQDLSFKGEETFAIVGDDNKFGDYVQITRGTSKSHDRTTHIGNSNYFMAFSHVGHDCMVGNKNVFANVVQLAGHVVVEDFVHFGGGSMVHQFSKIGRNAMLAGGTMQTGHLPPFCRSHGPSGAACGLNVVGIQRAADLTKEDIRDIREAHKIFFRKSVGFKDAIAQLKAMFAESKPVVHFVKFLEDCTQGDAARRPIVRQRGHRDV